MSLFDQIIDSDAPFPRSHKPRRRWWQDTPLDKRPELPVDVHVGFEACNHPSHPMSHGHGTTPIQADAHRAR